MSKLKRAQSKIADKDDAGVALLKAAGKWVQSCGGNVVVAGGISIMTWPGDLEYNFSVVVKCTGRKPSNPSSKEAKED
jgi:hypothetical protein